MKAKTIYLVYSERNIIAAFTDKHKAYTYLEFCKIQSPTDSTLRIDEYVCKDNTISSKAGVKEYFAAYAYFIQHNGTAVPVYVETKEVKLSDKEYFVVKPETGDALCTAYSLQSADHAKQLAEETVQEVVQRILKKKRKR